MIKYFVFVFVGLSVWGLPQSSRADLEINLNFAGFNSAPANVGTILNNASVAQARAVIESAADYWEEVFAGSDSSIAWSTNAGGTLTQNIDVTWGDLAGSTLATGGTGWFIPSGQWSNSATLTWDSDGTSSFFVDSTPLDSVEWNQFSSRGMDLGGVNVNVERVYYDAPAGVAQDNSDMLTVAVHEIAHALGFLGPFPSFAASDIGGDGDIDIVGGPLNGAEIPVLGGHTDSDPIDGISLLSPGNGDFPYDPGGNSFFQNFEYNPTVMAAGLNNGTRRLLTEADIAVVAQFLEFDMETVNFDARVAAIPEPSGLALLLIGCLGFAGRRHRKTR